MPKLISALLAISITLAIGFFLGILHQRGTDEHLWFIQELKKTKALNSLIDLKMSQSIETISIQKRR